MSYDRTYKQINRQTDIKTLDKNIWKAKSLKELNVE